MSKRSASRASKASGSSSKHSVLYASYKKLDLRQLGIHEISNRDDVPAFMASVISDLITPRSSYFGVDSSHFDHVVGKHISEEGKIEAPAFAAQFDFPHIPEDLRNKVDSRGKHVIGAFQYLVDRTRYLTRHPAEEQKWDEMVTGAMQALFGRDLEIGKTNVSVVKELFDAFNCQVLTAPKPDIIVGLKKANLHESDSVSSDIFDDFIRKESILFSLNLGYENAWFPFFDIELKTKNRPPAELYDQLITGLYLMLRIHIDLSKRVEQACPDAFATMPIPAGFFAVCGLVVQERNWECAIIQPDESAPDKYLIYNFHRGSINEVDEMKSFLPILDSIARQREAREKLIRFWLNCLRKAASRAIEPVTIRVEGGREDSEEDSEGEDDEAGSATKPGGKRLRRSGGSADRDRGKGKRKRKNGEGSGNQGRADTSEGATKTGKAKAAQHFEHQSANHQGTAGQRVREWISALDSVTVPKATWGRMGGVAAL